MYTGYSNSQIKIKHKDATSLIVKGKDVLPVTVNFSGGEAVISDLDAGIYALQFMKDSAVLFQDTLQVKQNLAYASSAYDPASNNRKILQAIDAYLAGIASSQQRRVKVGDKEIEYSSFDELIKWRNYYALQVRKEENKPVKLRNEKLYYRGL